MAVFKTSVLFTTPLFWNKTVKEILGVTWPNIIWESSELRECVEMTQKYAHPEPRSHGIIFLYLIMKHKIIIIL